MTALISIMRYILVPSNPSMVSKMTLVGAYNAQGSACILVAGRIDIYMSM